MSADLPVRGRSVRHQAAPFGTKDRLARHVADLHCALHPAVPAPAR